MIVPRTNNFFLIIADMTPIPNDGTITYARVLVNYHPQKTDSNWGCITVGGNLITYPGAFITRPMDLVNKIFVEQCVKNTSCKKHYSWCQIFLPHHSSRSFWIQVHALLPYFWTLHSIALLARKWKKWVCTCWSLESNVWAPPGQNNCQ